MHIIETYRHGYKEAWIRAFDFRGITSRKAYWEFVLIHCAVSALLLIMDLTSDGGMTLQAMLDLTYGVASFIPFLSITVRRLHDTCRSGWWLSGVFIPAIGWLLVTYFLLQPSHDQERFDDMNWNSQN